MSEQTLAAAHELLAKRFGRQARGAFVADPQVQTAAGSGAVVYLHQQWGGIPLFQGAVAAHVDVGEVVGEAVDAGPGDALPSLSAVSAVEAALGHFRPRTDRSMCRVRHPSLRRTMPTPSVLTSFSLPTRPTVLHVPRSRSWATAHLEWLAGDEAVDLAWFVRLPVGIESYLVLVAANGARAGEVLFCSRWSAAARCFATVFSFDHAAGRVRLPMPVDDGMFPQPLLGSPNRPLLADWVESDLTSGNNATTFFAKKETFVRAVAGEFPAALTPREQSLLNAFFFCNYLHDFFLLLGFGEAEGNFQNDPHKKGGDRLQIKLFETVFTNFAQMSARLDGEPAELLLGKASNGQPVAVHADVLIHEYAHGVTHRMVGGRRGAAALVEAQAMAMDEGWSDYFAITVRNHHLAAAGKPRLFGIAEWAGVGPTLRSALYDEHYPGHYGLIGKKPHHTINGAGEIFAMALIRFNELLGTALGDRVRGDCIGWRCVIASLVHIPPAKQTLLDGRDALLKAIDGLGSGGVLTPAESAEARTAAETAFRTFRMGPNAGRGKPSQLNGLTPDPA